MLYLFKTSTPGPKSKKLSAWRKIFINRVGPKRLKLAFSIQEKLCRFAVNVEKIQMRITVQLFMSFSYELCLVLRLANFARDLKGPWFDSRQGLPTYLPTFSFYVLVEKAKMNEEKVG